MLDARFLVVMNVVFGLVPLDFHGKFTIFEQLIIYNYKYCYV